MRLSTKGRFAVTAMIDVALRDEWRPVPLSDIALRLQVSLTSVEQIFGHLRQQGLVTSFRGPRGGYTLSRGTEAISVADIVNAIEGAPPKVKIRRTLATQDLAQDLWDSMNAKGLDFMQSVTLRSLVLEQLTKGVVIEQKPVPNRGVFKKPVHQPIRIKAPNSVFSLGQFLLARS
jgi:Rrf2 family iron-sulfur cluster assembly transcriptional regulator